MKLSIVIPVHNGASYIVRCLSSIAKQTAKEDDYEVIVVDDCSTDNSYFIAERFGEDFKNFRLLKTERKSGPGGARNFGVRNAVGDYIQFIDVDDYIFDKSVERLFGAMKEDFKKSPDVIMYPYEILKAKYMPEEKKVSVPKFKNIQQAAFSAVGPWTAVFKRELYVNMPENTLSEDTAWHFLQYDRFSSLGIVEGEEPLYAYDRLNATAITDTVAWCGSHSYTILQLAFENLAIKDNKRDQWISDVIRNFANMYDARRALTKPWVIDAWKQRFSLEYSNLMTGKYVH